MKVNLFSCPGLLLHGLEAALHAQTTKRWRLHVAQRLGRITLRSLRIVLCKVRVCGQGVVWWWC